MHRPRSITILGWLFIVVGLAGILDDVWPLLTPRRAQQLADLQAAGLVELGSAWAVRLLGVVGGAGLLRGRNWARWLLVGWMAFHIGVSLVHSAAKVLAHGLIFAPILFLLFRRETEPFFHPQSP
ncbi:MAG TPA: hypothetical protein VNH46_01295 [Gemmatimonadales bacterium]|nr:hypothetical protein [Gemmatimonadales bacterium]